MRTLAEIRKNLIAFYTSIQNKITDFSPGSVIGSIFYAFSSSLERLYAEIEEVRRQAYIATATGKYLDRLIDGTFQLKRRPSTRSVGYVTIYSNSPIVDFESLELKYAEYDRDTGQFTGGSQSSTKFVGYNVPGEEGIVFSLINPNNPDAIASHVDPAVTERLIHIDKPVQYLVLPVASIITGKKANVREGAIYSFPNPPSGVAGVLNTNNPGTIFFSSDQAVSGVPYYSRFTEVFEYNNSTSSFSVLNAFNFSNAGTLEVVGDPANENSIIATYTDGDIVRTAGIFFEYIDSSTSSVTLELPIENSLGTLPTMNVVDNNVVKELEITEVEYRGIVYPITDSEDLRILIENLIQSEGGLRIQEIPAQVSADLIFDPDGVLAPDYTLIDSARVSGASDKDTDAEYRDSLRAYLSSLARATSPALEAGTLQIPGVSFAKTLDSTLTPRGSVVVLATDESGTLPAGMRSTIRDYLEESWAAAGIHVIVQQPELIPINITATVRLLPGTSWTTVYQQIVDTVSEYLRGLNPGASLRYSDILTAIRGIGGVHNIFNLIISKQLTDDTYEIHKGSYDEVAMVSASTSGILEHENSGAFQETDAGSYVKYNSVPTPRYVITTDPMEAVGVLYRVSTVENIYEVLEGNAEVVYNMYEALVTNFSDAQTFDYFRNEIVKHREVFGDTEGEQLYFMSYILGEPVGAVPDSTSYPMLPEIIHYGSIKDYDASPVEIFRTNSTDIESVPTRLVGVKFI